MRPSPAESLESLEARVHNALSATGTYRDAERVLIAERARGEGVRARFLLAALLQRQDPAWQAEFFNNLADTPRPERAPFIDQQLGLEPFPPLPFSAAAPASMRQLARALAGRDLVPALLDQAERNMEAGEYIEAAGVLTMAQLMLPREAQERTLRPVVAVAWERLARQRRCVARLYDAAQPGKRLLRSDLPEGLPPDQAVAASLTAEPDTVPCAILAAQMATSKPNLGQSADLATRALMAPIVSSPRFATLSLTSTARAAPPPLTRGGNGDKVREALERGLALHLRRQPGDARRLLPFIGTEPYSTLLRERREDLTLAVLMAAPPVPEAGIKLRWAYRRHLSVVSGDPRRYVEYMRRLGPAFLDALVLALREPDGQVVSDVVSTLSSYPAEVVAEALEGELGETTQWTAQERHNREQVRALFRLPMRGDEAERQTAWREALDLHRCCRGDQGTCDRLALPAIKTCPVWTPLTWW